MREILFRGKRIKDEKWIEGSLLTLDADNGYYFITEPYESASTLPVRDLIYNHTCLVDPKTVCQYIGLTDRNGKKIFEGDILYGEFYGYPFPCNETFRIYWDESEKGFEANYFNENNCEIIGNIFDNPELLKVGNIYTYNNEADMLKVANELEAEGFTVRRFRISLKFCVEITGYR